MAQMAVLHDFFQIGVYHVANIIMARIDHIHLLALHVKADDVKARLGLFHRQGQAHIAQAHHAQGNRTVQNFFLQIRHCRMPPFCLVRT